MLVLLTVIKGKFNSEEKKIKWMEYLGSIISDCLK